MASLPNSLDKFHNTTHDDNRVAITDSDFKYSCLAINYRVINHGNSYIDADDITDFIHWILVFIAIPSVSILGVIGNTLSICVLYKRGLEKSSSILLFSLAISDIVYMIGVNGPPKIIYEWGRGGFQYAEETARVLYYLYNLFDTLNWGSGPTSLCIPVLITVERLIAVFMPLKFPFIVTPRRTVIATMIPNVFFYGLQAYMRTWFQFVYVFDSFRNASVGFAMRSEIYWLHRDVSEVLEVCFNSMIILVVFVGSGCVAIGFKVRSAAIIRFQMTNRFNQKSRSEVNTFKTTKTLLVLCIFYTVACAFVTLPAVIPKFMVFPLFLEEPNFRSVGVFVYHIFKLVLSINASINFLIYVVMNKNFRDTFVSILNCN